jgi:predicted Na+-dependent transporter
MGNVAVEVGAHILLFFLVFGMSATVNVGDMRKQLRNRTALSIGLILQFIILPFVGFCVVKILKLEDAAGITLLVVTSSPGGSYSNWWCSLFNAELALSVTMTGLSTLLSIGFMPLNLTMYGSNVVNNLDFAALFVSLVVVLSGISLGVLLSAWYNSTRFNLLANKLGNLAGLSLVVFSAVVSTSGSDDVNLWSHGWNFYLAVLFPALIGVSIATVLATRFKLDKPERVAVAVEGCYQNTGIATSVAASMFSGSDLAIAVSVPLLYGLFEAVILAIYCLSCWKIGWTKAPKDENICTVIFTSYEVEQARLTSPNAIEVVHNNNPTGDEDVEDLVFNQTTEGYQVDETSLHEKTNADLRKMPSKESMEKTEDLSLYEEEEEDNAAKAEQGEFT